MEEKDEKGSFIFVRLKSAMRSAEQIMRGAEYTACGTRHAMWDARHAGHGKRITLCMARGFIRVCSKKGLRGMSVVDDVKSLHADTLSAIAQASDTEALEKIRVEVVGKSGSLTGYLRSMGQIEKNIELK